MRGSFRSNGRWLTSVDVPGCLSVTGRTSSVPDKAEVERGQKQREVDQRAHTAERGRLDEVGAENRYRQLGEIHVELNTSGDKERASQKFAELLTANSKIKRRSTDHDDGRDQKRRHAGFDNVTMNHAWCEFDRQAHGKSAQAQQVDPSRMSRRRTRIRLVRCA